MKKLHSILRLTGLLLFAFGIAALGWGLLEPPQSVHRLFFEAETLQELNPKLDMPLGEWQLVLTYPEWIRAGDIGRVELRFTPMAAGDALLTGSQIEEVVFFESRFEVVGLMVAPLGSLRKSFNATQSTSFWWQVAPQQVGNYEGTAWLSLGVQGAQGEETIPLAAPKVSLQAQRFAGLSGPAARWLGLGAILGGMILSLWRRRNAGN